MCIKDNPRFKHLVGIGCLRFTTNVLYELSHGICYVYLDEDEGIFKGGWYRAFAFSPEEAFDKLFTNLEKFHASHQ